MFIRSTVRYVVRSRFIELASSVTHFHAIEIYVVRGTAKGWQSSQNKRRPVSSSRGSVAPEQAGEHENIRVNFKFTQRNYNLNSIYIHIFSIKLAFAKNGRIGFSVRIWEHKLHACARTSFASATAALVWDDSCATGEIYKCMCFFPTSSSLLF